MRENLNINFNPTSDDQRWEITQARDSSFNGTFVYGVHSTRIYCKPSCPSKRPKRQNVTFFVSNKDAEKAGFRSCQRCRPQDGAQDASAKLVQKICQAIAASENGAPSLKKLSAEVGVSSFHLQRTFKQVMGITPHQYAKAHRIKEFKNLIKEGETVVGAMYDAGFGSSSRLYEQSDKELGMPPAVYARGGAGMKINFTVAVCKLGFLLVAATERGLCSVQLGNSECELRIKLFDEFPASQIEKDDSVLGEWTKAILRYLDNEQKELNLPLDVRETAFQRRVWTELRKIPYGETRSYSDIARAIERPTAARAVARACATNPVALVTPCHRIVRENGAMGGYRWGIERKQKLIAQELKYKDKLNQNVAGDLNK